MLTIYHNPRCSKSRAALAMVEQFAAANQLTLEVVDYQKIPPTPTQLAALQKKLGTEVQAMVRDNEPEFTELGLAHADEATLLNAIAQHPKLLQRPIVVYRERAMIGRPPENLATLLQTD